MPTLRNDAREVTTHPAVEAIEFRLGGEFPGDLPAQVWDNIRAITRLALDALSESPEILEGLTEMFGRMSCYQGNPSDPNWDPRCDHPECAATAALNYLRGEA